MDASGSWTQVYHYKRQQQQTHSEENGADMLFIKPKRGRAPLANMVNQNNRYVVRVNGIVSQTTNDSELNSETTSYRRKKYPAPLPPVDKTPARKPNGLSNIPTKRINGLANMPSRKPNRTGVTVQVQNTVPAASPSVSSFVSGSSVRKFKKSPAPLPPAITPKKHVTIQDEFPVSVEKQDERTLEEKEKEIEKEMDEIISIMNSPEWRTDGDITRFAVSGFISEQTENSETSNESNRVFVTPTTAVQVDISRQDSAVQTSQEQDHVTITYISAETQTMPSETAEEETIPQSSTVASPPPPPPPPPPPVAGNAPARQHTPKAMKVSFVSEPITIGESADDVISDCIAQQEDKSPSRDANKTTLPKLDQITPFGGPVLRRQTSSSSVEPMSPTLYEQFKSELFSAAVKRSQKGHIEPPPRRAAVIALHEEIKAAAKERETRQESGAIRMRNTSSNTKLFLAKKNDSDSLPSTPRSPLVIASSPVDEVFESELTTEEHSETQTNQQDKMDNCDQATFDVCSQEEEVTSHEQVQSKEVKQWVPQEDLSSEDEDDEDEGMDVEITARGKEMPKSFSVISTLSPESETKSKKSRPSNLQKARKAVKSALGTIGRAVHRRKKIDEMFDENWEIYQAEEFDDATGEAIKVSHMERRHAYAYNPRRGQLVLLPEYETVIVTEDGRRIQESALKGKKKKVKRFAYQKTERLKEREERAKAVNKFVQEREQKFEQQRAMEAEADKRFQQMRESMKSKEPENNYHNMPSSPRQILPPVQIEEPQEIQGPHLPKSKSLDIKHFYRIYDKPQNDYLDADIDEPLSSSTTESDSGLPGIRLGDSGYRTDQSPSTGSGITSLTDASPAPSIGNSDPTPQVSLSPTENQVTTPPALDQNTQVPYPQVMMPGQVYGSQLTHHQVAGLTLGTMVPLAFSVPNVGLLQPAMPTAMAAPTLSNPLITPTTPATFLAGGGVHSSGIAPINGHNLGPTESQTGSVTSGPTGILSQNLPVYSQPTESTDPLQSSWSSTISAIADVSQPPQVPVPPPPPPVHAPHVTTTSHPASSIGEPPIVVPVDEPVLRETGTTEGENRDTQRVNAELDGTLNSSGASLLGMPSFYKAPGVYRPVQFEPMKKTLVT